MAGVLKLIHSQEFINTDTITVIHNSGQEYLKVKIVVDGMRSSSIIKSITTSKSDPTNILTVTLLSSQTGFIQLFDIDTISIGEDSATDLTFA